MSSSKSSHEFEEFSTPPPSSKTSPRPRFPRFAYLVLAAASLAVFTVGALLQSPRPVPHPVAPVLSADFWRYPIVLNEIKQLQAITVEGSAASPDLNAVWTSGNAQEVWIGGNSAVLLHSGTRGRVWHKVEPVGPEDSGKSDLSLVSRHFWPTLPVVLASGGVPQQPNSQANQQAPSQSSQKAVQSRLPNLVPNDNAPQNSAPPQKLATQSRPPANEPVHEQPVQSRLPPNLAPSSPSVPCSFAAGNITEIYFSPSSSLVVFAPTASGRPWCSSQDGGRTWTLGAGAVPSLSQLLESTSSSITTRRGYQVQVGAHGSIKILNRPVPAQPKSHTDANLKAVAFSDDGRSGFAVGERGTAIKTEDGGNTWFPVLQGLEGENLPAQKPRKLPAPWYYFSWLLAAAIAWPALGAAPDSPLRSEASIANLGVSDRPLEPTDADPLGYKDLALSISRFVRNENTIAPITIAITGEWGTGKSSIMNLLRRDLTARGLRPIWFNVWHNQTEDDLFATILQNVRKQGVPYWWQLDYFSFRLRLLAIRWADRLAPLTMLLMAIAFLAGIEWQHRNDHQLNNLFESLRSWDSFLGFLKVVSHDPLWVFLVCILYAVKYVREGMKAFGVDPASLLASRSGQTSLASLEKQTALRQKFSEELKEVTSALGPGRRMVLFIDDLDRCLPDNIRVALEAVNFMVTSGECFVIMGFARPAVEAGVGLSFEKLAGEMSRSHVLKGNGLGPEAAPADPADKEDLARNDRTRFAQQYLDKLINIEIPARPRASARTEDLVLDNARTAVRESNMRRFSRVATGMILPGILAVFLICLTAATGLQIGKPSLAPAGTTLQPPPAPPAKPVTVSPAVANTAGVEQMLPKQAFPIALSLSALGSARNSSLAYLWPLAGISLLTYGFWRMLLRKDDRKVKDSPDFRNALEIWDSVIVLSHLTPRATKRFMNRVRCLAMRLRPAVELETRWSLLRRSPDTETQTSSSDRNATQLPESCLVALSAMYDISPRLVRDKELYEKAVSGAAESLTGVGMDARLTAKFREALKKHLTVFRKEWPASSDQRTTYLELFSDFTVRG